MSRKYTGWLGWSNTRGGIDFYHSAEDGRHNHDEQYHGHGHLLAFDMTTDDGMHPLEGHKVVVIVGDDRAEEPEGVWVNEDSLAAAMLGADFAYWVGAHLDDGVERELAAAIIQAAKEAERAD